MLKTIWNVPHRGHAETLPPAFNAIILWIHLSSAVLFVGGSFFIWLIAMPALDIIKDESERTQAVQKMVVTFGRLSGVLLAVLILTGVYNASWYLPSTGALFDTFLGNLLLTKIVLVVILVFLVFIHGLYYGRKILELSRQRKLEELKTVRRRSRLLSAITLVLMAAILMLAVFLQIPP